MSEQESFVFLFCSHARRVLPHTDDRNHGRGLGTFVHTPEAFKPLDVVASDRSQSGRQAGLP